jgi:SM-20-related protein
VSEPVLHAFADSLAQSGWCVVPGFIPAARVRDLAAQARAQWRSGGFHAAGTGTGAAFAVRPAVRGDHVLWLEPETASPAQRRCLDHFEALRLVLNRELQLGLLDFECHFAVYPAGARYGRHIDRFKGDARRALSCVLYLNEHWPEEQGGQLRLYLDEEHTMDVIPRGGTLVAFLSDRFEHEVLPATSERLSLAGWFRRRS